MSSGVGEDGGMGVQKQGRKWLRRIAVMRQRCRGKLGGSRAERTAHFPLAPLVQLQTNEKMVSEVKLKHVTGDLEHDF